MVMFCRKSNEPFTFRDPVEADYLGTRARRNYLLPRHEIDAAIFEQSFEQGNLEILKRGHTAKLEVFHKNSAVGHWGIMRDIVPDAIWENW